MNLTIMNDEEFEAYKGKVLNELGDIAEAVGHPFVAYLSKHGNGKLVDLDTLVPTFTDRE